MKADVILGLSYGDEGKGKVTYSLLQKEKYDYCVRFNGSHNAGHTIYHNNKKIITHSIPTGVVKGVKSIIGPGCVINPLRLVNEINDLKIQISENIQDLIFIDKRVNLISPDHVDKDSRDSIIGTTKRGNGPAYSDKYARSNTRIENYEHKNNFNITDLYQTLHIDNPNCEVLFEGAQGFYLDIDWGDYPYVTSSHCGIGGVINNGVPPQSLRRIYGVVKAYDTYVGNKKFQPDDDILLDTIRNEGKEFGSTTGRPRQTNYLGLNNLVQAIKLNGVTDLIVNKVDILEKTNIWKVINYNQIIDLKDKNNFLTSLSNIVKLNCDTVKNIRFSFSPYEI